MGPRSFLSCFPVSIFGFLAAGAIGQDTLDYDVLEYINPLIGSTEGGTVFFICTMVYPTNLPFLLQEMYSPAHQCRMAWPKPLPTRTPQLTREDLHTMAATSPASRVYMIQGPEDPHRSEIFLFFHT